MPGVPQSRQRCVVRAGPGVYHDGVGDRFCLVNAHIPKMREKEIEKASDTGAWIYIGR